MVISHLIFADDSFLFFRANERGIYTIKEVLHVYGEASSQEVNFSKSEVYFVTPSFLNYFY